MRESYSRFCLVNRARRMGLNSVFIGVFEFKYDIGDGYSIIIKMFSMF